MEAEPKTRQTHRKRRERAHRVPVDESDTEQEQDGEDISPSRGAKERGRSKPRKKKNSPGTYEEDIIDGFAIVSFKSIEDLEKFTAGKLTCKTPSSKTKRNSSLSPARHKAKQNVKMKKKKKKRRLTRNTIQKTKKHNNSAADNSDSSGETTDNLDTSEFILNGPKKPTLSDVSTRSSSGAGYECDSESGDERVSDGSLDIFAAKPLNPSIKSEPVIPCSIPLVLSPPSLPTTTACSVTLSTSDVTVTTATTTTSCVTLATTLSTTSVSVTTATPTVQTTASNNLHSHLNHHHNHHSNYQPPPPSPLAVSTATTTVQENYSPQPLPATIESHRYPTLPATVDSSIKKHSPHLNHQSHNQQHSYLNHQTRPINLEKPVSIDKHLSSGEKVEKKPRLSGSPVPKRHLPSPQISRLSRSPPRHKPNPPPPPLTSVSRSSSPFIVSSAQSLPSTSSTSTSVISREPKRTPPLSRTPQRETPLDRDPFPQVLPPSLGVSKSIFPPGFQGHGATPSLYSPLGPSPGLHPLHSTPSHSAAYPGPGLTSLHHPHHPATPQPSQPAHNMFAPPLPLGPPAGPLPGTAPSAPAAHLQPESPLPIANPDLLREELNRRFLASQDRSPLLQGVPPFFRADIHQHMHQHQHQHQHTHQHTYTGLAPPPVSASSIVPPTPNPHMFEKISSNPFFRQGLPPGIAEPAPRIIPNGKDKPVLPQHPRSAIPGLPGYPSLLINPAAPGPSDPISSGLPGAFQPKGLSGLHPVPGPGPMFMHGREIEKSASHLTAPPPSGPTSAKKPGKWCAVHVRIAWEIYRQQQKLPSEKGSESRSSDSLRPPSHLLPGSSMSYPDRATSTHSFLSSSRSVLASSPHNILNSAGHIGPPTFPRPSPYSIGTSLPLGIGNSIPSSREPPPIPSASHEWNRLHRTPPTFPTPPSWTKSGEREKEMEREREISMERRREEERERERRLMDHDHHRFSSLDERSRDRARESDILSKSRSRSRSRSPMRNGRIDPIKSERSYDRRPEESSMLKIKEERRDSLVREEELLSLRAAEGSLRAADPFMHTSLMDRARMLNPATFLGGERAPAPHPSLWNPFDKGPSDFMNHRLGLPREFEQARDPFLTRMPGPGVHPSFAGFALEQERIREEIILRDTERAKRDYLERLPLLERERLYYENSKIPTLRPPDHLAHPFGRNMSPALNHLKRSSPSVGPGGPPPLIHSIASSQTRGHGSPIVNKTKGVSPTDSVGESKRDSNSNSTDPDAHSR